jgi:hypothetical protein
MELGVAKFYKKVVNMPELATAMALDTQQEAASG